MDAFLNEARSSGTHDSQGVFTINADKAEVKIAKFQLARTEQFPMFLLAAGTQAGAAGFEATFPSRGKTRVRFRGWSLSPTDFHYIGTRSLKEGTPIAFRYLAIAFSTIGHRYDFAVRCADFQVAFVKQTMREVHVSEEIEKDVLEIEIEGDLEKAIWDGLTGQQKFCPFPVRVGRRELAGGYDPSTESLDAYAFYFREGPGLSTVALKYPSEIVQRHPPSNAPPMAVSFTHAPDAEKLGFWLLVNGLACRTPRDFVPSGFFGVAVADGLQLSLSHEIIQNRAFRNLQVHIWNACKGLCQYTRTKLDGFANPLRLSMLSVSLRSLERGYSSPHEIEQEQLPELSEAEGLVGYPLVPATEPGSLAELLVLVRELDEDGRAVLLSAYRARVLQHFKKGAREEALSWYGALLEIKKTLVQLQEIDIFVEQLLRGRMAPSGDESNRYEYDRLKVLAAYLQDLAEWEQGREPNFRLTSMDSTWLVPVGLHDVAGEPWAQLVRALERGDISTGMRLAQQSSELCFRGHELAWRTYFWSHHRGDLSWIEAVALRVALSFSELCAVEQEASKAELTVFSLAKERSRSPFWPSFLSLLERAAKSKGERGRREAWAKLIVTDILSQLLQRPQTFTLQEPFRPFSPS